MKLTTRNNDSARSRPARVSRWSAALLLTITLLGCTGSQLNPEDPGHPSLALIDSIALVETDTSSPEKVFAVASDGDFLIADEFMSHVLRFSPNGVLQQRYGRRGGGPGEFRGTLSFTMVTDSLVVQATPGKFVAYDRHTGQFRFARQHRRAFPTTWSVVGDSLVLGMMDFGAKNAIAVVPIADRFGGEGSNDVHPIVPDRAAFPPEYLSHPALQAFSMAYAAAWADSMLVGYQGVPYLVRYTLRGVPLDTAWIPSVSRRGFPDGWMDPFASGKQPTLQQMVGAFSFLAGLWRLPDGNFLLWHQENAIDESQRQPKFSGTPHISILSADLQRACVDAPVLFPGTELPRITVKGDTLYALDQVGNRDLTRVTTVIRRYRVSTKGCRWLPTRPA